MNILSNIFKLNLNELNKKYKIEDHECNIDNIINVYSFNNDTIIYKYIKDKYLNFIKLYDSNDKLFYTYYLDFDDRNNIKYYKIRKNYENIKIKYNFITGGR